MILPTYSPSSLQAKSLKKPKIPTNHLSSSSFFFPFALLFFSFLFLVSFHSAGPSTSKGMGRILKPSKSQQHTIPHTHTILLFSLLIKCNSH
ncbi:hypothetical protein Dimus_038763 [Dionaea muscipula]